MQITKQAVLLWMLPWPLTRGNAVMVELIEGTGVGCYALAGARVTLTLTLARGREKKLTVAHDNRDPRSK